MRLRMRIQGQREEGGETGQNLQVGDKRNLQYNNNDWINLYEFRNSITGSWLLVYLPRPQEKRAVKGSWRSSRFRLSWEKRGIRSQGWWEGWKWLLLNWIFQTNYKREDRKQPPDPLQRVEDNERKRRGEALIISHGNLGPVNPASSQLLIRINHLVLSCNNSSNWLKTA